MSGTAAKSPKAPSIAPSPAEVRAWARENGVEVNDKGKIRASVYAAYETAHAPGIAPAAHAPAAGPPPGWYADPAGGASQRWWDGQAWTEHRQSPAPIDTRPTIPAPRVAADNGTAARSAAAGLGAVEQHSDGVPQPTRWYRRKAAVVGVGLVVAIVVIAAVVGGSHGSGDMSHAMEQDIMTTGSAQLQANIADFAADATATVDDAQCVKTAGTQEYTCLVHYSVSEPSSGFDQKYVLNVAGTCDSSEDCQWHATGDGAPVAQ